MERIRPKIKNGNEIPVNIPRTIFSKRMSQYPSCCKVVENKYKTTTL